MINRTLLAFIFLICQSIFSQTEKNEIDEEQKKVDSLKVEKKVDSLKVDKDEKINPWQQSDGEILIATFVNYYTAGSFRDSNGNKSDFANNGKFTNSNPRVYVAYPLLSHKINIVASIPYFLNRSKNDDFNDTNSDFGDIEFGFKFHLANFKYNYLMASAVSIIPAYENNKGNEPFTGFEQFGVESRLILAGTLNHFGDYSDFHKVEIGLRHFFNDPTQIRFLISEGFNISDEFQVIGELDGIFSFSDKDDFFQQNLQLVSEFNVIKASINLGYNFSESFAIYTGLFQDVYNRNSAIGRGIQFSTVIKVN